MSWIQKLYETYEYCAEREPEGATPLLPICHTTQQAQIEVVLDEKGTFKRASILEKSAGNTMIPCTEASGGRAGSKPVNHPLCDKLQYVAGDFLNYGGTVTSGFAAKPEEPYDSFLADLGGWLKSDFHNSKVEAIHNYVSQRRLIADLVASGVIQTDKEDRKILKKWEGAKENTPAIFKSLSNGQTPEDAFVRWRVEQVGTPETGTWEDESLITAWIGYYQSRQSKQGYCMVSGNFTKLAEQHPAKLRHGGDKAKLISANDIGGYTFRGKFLDSDQALSVGFEITQKAHNALRWLINRQSYRHGDQAIVSWAVSGASILNPFSSTLDLFPEIELAIDHLHKSDTAQSFALQLKHAIAGYGSKLAPSDAIVVMGLDSATPGRSAITFYRELKGSDFLKRIENWHAHCAWPQNFGKDKQFIGAPAPRDIVEAAYGRRPDEKLSKAVVERLLPCIVDGLPPPHDLVVSTTRRASNPLSFNDNGKLDKWEWKKCLGIACALFRGHHFDRSYAMDLEQDRTTRDYLYGRLLAIADNIEGYALYLSDEGKKRETTAIRFMQRFAARPFSTWATIELSLVPYLARLKAGSDKSALFLFKRRQLLDEVMTKLDKLDQRTSDSPLSGEFLLGYHCQRQNFRIDTKSASTDDTNTQNVTE